MLLRKKHEKFRETDVYFNSDNMDFRLVDNVIIGNIIITGDFLLILPVVISETHLLLLLFHKLVQARVLHTYPSLPLAICEPVKTSFRYLFQVVTSHRLKPNNTGATRNHLIAV